MRDMFDPLWFWQVSFADGTSALFYANSKALALDHARTLGDGYGRQVSKVTRIKHATRVGLEEDAIAGELIPAPCA